MIDFQYNDGGREAAGYKGKTGDCAVRAIAIATGMDYQKAYDLVLEYGQRERISKKKKSKSHPRTGVYTPTMKKIMSSLGWEFVATMGIGTGCKVHLDAAELPRNNIIVNLSKHYAAVLDGVVHDTYLDDRNGTRCVYGYWVKS